MSDAEPDAKVQAALQNLSDAIIERVRDERIRDQLTGLRNNHSELLQDFIDRKIVFWAAFVEIDHFKSINDRFGYEKADALLQRVAESLKSQINCFPLPNTTGAFRPHGDEFYLVGECRTEDAGEIEESLRLVSGIIAQTRVPGNESMRCTASIGWMFSMDLLSAIPMTLHTINAALEAAVAEAKWNRGTVVRFNKSVQHGETLGLRTDCPTCRTKISLSVKRSEYDKHGEWSCPLCRSAVDRPPAPEVAKAPPPANV
jgi:diguanylate cyclase (GGDEF)-like protein